VVLLVHAQLQLDNATRRISDRTEKKTKEQQEEGQANIGNNTKED
jgi:hypothetical protein